MALKHGDQQPFLFSDSGESSQSKARRITVHVAIEDSDLERSVHKLLYRNVAFTVVKGGIGYAAESDVRIIDCRMDPEQENIYDEQRPPRTLFIGLDDSVDSLVEALEAGAWSYVPESADTSELQEAIFELSSATGSPLLQKIARSEQGAKYVTERMSSDFIDSPASKHSNLLSPLESRILGLIARGEPSKRIGDVVGLGEQTVKNYVVKILEKTNTHNRAHAAAVAAQRGWLESLDE